MNGSGRRWSLRRRALSLPLVTVDGTYLRHKNQRSYASAVKVRDVRFSISKNDA